MIRKRYIPLVTIATVFLVVFLINYNQESDNISSETPSISGDQEPEEIALNLNAPWSIVPLPGSSLLVTQRSGGVLVVSSDGNSTEIGQIDGVVEIGEGGLLGAEIHPDYSTNNLIYFYHTYRENNSIQNRIVSYVLDQNILQNRQIIISGIPGASNHNGGRIKFGPDGYLYVTTGDAANPSLSQNTSSLAGKILRITSQGDPAPGNPFDNEVFSYGHRNPQGLAWDDQGRLWSTEHGPSARDELNLIEIGDNYGWPTITGSQQRQGMEPSLIHSGNDTWAPSGLAFANNAVYFVGLRGQALYKYDIQTENLESAFDNQFGRLRDVIFYQNNLYFITNNTDGRGRIRSGDDKLIKTAFF